MKHPGAARLKPSRWRGLKFKVRNFVSGRLYRAKCNTILWFKVHANNRRRFGREDRRWQEAWWCLEKRYTKLAKRYTRMELKYLKQKDEIRRLRHGNS